MKKIILVLILYSCQNIFVQQIFENYYLTGGDTEEEISISYKIDDGNYIEILNVYNKVIYIDDDKIIYICNTESTCYLIDTKQKVNKFHIENSLSGPYSFKKKKSFKKLN